MIISSKVLTHPQAIDACPYDIFVSDVFERLNGIDLVRWSKVSTKWYQWIVKYAPSGVQKHYPDYHRENLMGQVALTILFKRAVTSYNLVRCRFSHISIDIDPITNGTTVVYGLQGNLIFKSSSHPAFPGGSQIFLLSSETGKLERVLPSSSHPWVIGNSVWMDRDREFLQCWNLLTGQLIHSFPLNVWICDLQEIEGHIVIAGIEGKTEKCKYVLPPKGTQFKKLQIPEGFQTFDGNFGVEGNFCSLICAHANEYKKVLYSLNGKSQLVPPETIQDFILPTSLQKIIKRYRCHDLDLIYYTLNNPNSTETIQILQDSLGNSCFPYPIYNFTKKGSTLLLIARIENKNTLVSFDPITRKILKTCPLEVASISGCAWAKMIFIEDDNILLFAEAKIMIINTVTLQIIQSAELPMKHFNFYPGYASYDGEKISILSDLANPRVHVFDFNVAKPQPTKSVKLTAAEGFGLGADKLPIGKDLATTPRAGMDLYQGIWRRRQQPRSSNWGKIALLVGIIVFVGLVLVRRRFR